MNRGVCLVGLVAFLVVCLQFGATSAQRYYGRRGYGRKSSLEYKLRLLEDAVEGLKETTQQLDGRLNRTEHTVAGLATQEFLANSREARRNCQTGEEMLDTPINETFFVFFKTPFSNPPQVAASLSGVSLFLLKSCQLRVGATTTEGFYLTALGRGLSVDLFYSWIACPSAAFDSKDSVLFHIRG